MSENKVVGVLGVAALASIVAMYYYLKHVEVVLLHPSPVRAAPQARPETPAAERPQVLEPSRSNARLPALGASDRFVMKALAGLVGSRSLMQLLHPDRIITNIVVTIDNLPRDHLPVSTMPLREVPGMFTASATGDQALAIDQKNAERYAPYVRFADAVSPQSAVQAYLTLYPLFQRAYENVGYPGKYFNDRLMEAIDDLLDAPDISGPVKVVQPKVVYQYADPEFEQRSIGQRIVMRVGSKNEADLKARLRAIKHELLLHMRPAGGLARA